MPSQPCVTEACREAGTRKQTMLAASTTLGVVVPWYAVTTYYTAGLQNAVRGLGGIRQLLEANPGFVPVYDVVEASALALFTVVVGCAIFLSMSRRTSRRRLGRGVTAALPLVVLGSALGRYWHNLSDPMPGLLIVVATILASTGIAMYVATNQATE